MARSILLRGFDADMADKIGDYMESEGTRIHRGTVPTAIHKTDSGRLLVRWRDAVQDPWAVCLCVLSIIEQGPHVVSLHVGVNVSGGVEFHRRYRVDGGGHGHAGCGATCSDGWSGIGRGWRSGVCVCVWVVGCGVGV